MGATGSGDFPSVARTLGSEEVKSLAALALALPHGWVVVVEPPYGQLAITPRVGRRRFHRAWVASGDGRRIYRDCGLPGDA